MATDTTDAVKQIDQLLNQPHVMWLLGAGISKDANVPLMIPLTKRVAAVLEEPGRSDYEWLLDALPDSSHVEHVLSHLGDLISIASRRKDSQVELNSSERTVNDLRNLHRAIQAAIRDTIQWGYKPSSNGRPEEVGCRDEPIVSITHHVAFVDALFGKRRAGLDRRPPVVFFTTNYDTLLEDALALCRVPTSDGFCGGATAFWNANKLDQGFQNPFSEEGGYLARVFKLHGSIDWFRSNEDVVVRRRSGAAYSMDNCGQLLIYPEATKYAAARQEPFMSTFDALRGALATPKQTVLIICGCSLCDEHITEEIEFAMNQRQNQLTLLVFIKQPDEETLPADGGLPSCLVNWLQGKQPWRERVVAAGSRGVYHGNLTNLCPVSSDRPNSWWTFAGLTKFLEHGPEATL